MGDVPQKALWNMDVAFGMAYEREGKANADSDIQNFVHPWGSLWG